MLIKPNLRSKFNKHNPMSPYNIIANIIDYTNNLKLPSVRFLIYSQLPLSPNLIIDTKHILASGYTVGYYRRILKSPTVTNCLAYTEFYHSILI